MPYSGSDEDLFYGYQLVGKRLLIGIDQYRAFGQRQAQIQQADPIQMLI